MTSDTHTINDAQTDTVAALNRLNNAEAQLRELSIAIDGTTFNYTDFESMDPSKVRLMGDLLSAVRNWRKAKEEAEKQAP